MIESFTYNKRSKTTSPRRHEKQPSVGRQFAAVTSIAEDSDEYDQQTP